MWYLFSKWLIIFDILFNGNQGYIVGRQTNFIFKRILIGQDWSLGDDCFWWIHFKHLNIFLIKSISKLFQSNTCRDWFVSWICRIFLNIKWFCYFARFYKDFKSIRSKLKYDLKFLICLNHIELLPPAPWMKVIHSLLFSETNVL